VAAGAAVAGCLAVEAVAGCHVAAAVAGCRVAAVEEVGVSLVAQR
jgi:hypothetical protein